MHRIFGRFLLGLWCGWTDGGGAVLRMASCSVCPSMCDLWFCGVSMLGKVLGVVMCLVVNMDGMVGDVGVKYV